MCSEVQNCSEVNSINLNKIQLKSFAYVKFKKTLYDSCGVECIGVAIVNKPCYQMYSNIMKSEIEERRWWSNKVSKYQLTLMTLKNGNDSAWPPQRSIHHRNRNHFFAVLNIT